MAKARVIKKKRVASNPEHQMKLKEVGAKIRALRKAKGYTSHDTFAYDHNLDRTQYSKYERGADMQLTSLMNIVKAMGISLEEFFKGL